MNTKQVITSTIYNTTTKTKSQLRAEGDKALQLFLKRGGAITEVKASRKKTTRTTNIGRSSRWYRYSNRW